MFVSNQINYSSIIRATFVGRQKADASCYPYIIYDIIHKYNQQM